MCCTAAPYPLFKLTVAHSLIYTYFEQNNNRAFLVVQDILEYGFQDNIFSSFNIKQLQEI